MDPIAEAYVKLVLAVGEHDEDYVDAYYGPAAWRYAVLGETPALPAIESRARELLDELETVEAGDDEMLQLRREYLRSQIRALAGRARMLQGAEMSFDEESRALYDAVAPTLPDEHFERMIAELDGLLPGEGPLVERYESFKSRFVVPPDRLAAVFRTAIDGCRERTRRHIELPEGESFEIEYVSDKPWGGYNWYKGGYHSLIQINTDLPTYIDRALGLACHEGYPGHHVYNALLEQRMLRGRGWVEFSVYALFSPQSLIAEGTANFGVELVFPDEERIEFERRELFPLAGLDPADTDLYYRVAGLVEKLGYASNEAARRYLDGQIDAAQAAELLGRLGLMPPDRAQQRVEFIERYRSYVINYNLGEDLVREFVDARAGGDTARRWEVFGRLLSSPRLPSGLKTASP
jgi:hypothetical protein